MPQDDSYLSETKWATSRDGDRKVGEDTRFLCVRVLSTCSANYDVPIRLRFISPWPRSQTYFLSGGVAWRDSGWWPRPRHVTRVLLKGEGPDLKIGLLRKGPDPRIRVSRVFSQGGQTLKLINVSRIFGLEGTGARLCLSCSEEGGGSRP